MATGSGNNAICSNMMDLETVILSEVSQTEREMWYDIHYTCNLKGHDTS